MKVLFVSSEGYPFVKSGGLGDVVGSLPMALKKEGLDVRVVIPLYQDIPEEFKKEMKEIKTFNVPVGWRNQSAVVSELQMKGITFYFIKNQYYFDRKGLYGYYDDGERFSFFCRGILEMLYQLDYKPDILHCHDWHTGPVALLLKSIFKENDFFHNIKTVYTIHNLKYQGVFPPIILGDLLGLDDSYFTPEGVEFYGGVSFMKAGIVYSDYVTTVSPTYGEEIQLPFYGERLEGLLRARRDKLKGILNGIDTELYNPKTDNSIINYDRRNITRKLKNKTKLQEELGLPVDYKIPIIGMVTRLVSQKGLDLLLRVLDEILQRDLQLVILGTGDIDYENLLKEKANQHPEKLSTNIYFGNKKAHLIYAASDLFLMPSLFEPCGIGQLIALRYGSVPIVRETGGLKDTIFPFNEFTLEGNGFSFTNYNAHDMLHTIDYALSLYHNKSIWNKIIKNAMKCDYSWQASAKEYHNVYINL